MYAKIFQSIYDGTLVEDWRALITFEQLLILSDADGIVDMTAHAIARRTGIPIEHIEAGIKYLEQPDEHSRTATAEGRRIVRLNEDRNWGWQIVNHSTYRDMRTADDRRDYMRKYMKDFRKTQQNQGPSKPESLQKLTVNDGKPSLAPLANTYTDTYTDTDTNNNITSGLHPDLKVEKRNYQNEAAQVLQFLNEKTGKNFRPFDTSGKPTASLQPIIQRLKTGITVQDCKTVIARKHREWSQGGDGKFGKSMLEYMRPKTLFAASNFENYLGECTVKNG